MFTQFICDACRLIDRRMISYPQIVQLVEAEQQQRIDILILGLERFVE